MTLNLIMIAVVAVGFYGFYHAFAAWHHYTFVTNVTEVWRGKRNDSAYGSAKTHLLSSIVLTAWSSLCFVAAGIFFFNTGGESTRDICSLVGLGAIFATVSEGTTYGKWIEYKVKWWQVYYD